MICLHYNVKSDILYLTNEHQIFTIFIAYHVASATIFDLDAVTSKSDTFSLDLTAPGYYDLSNEFMQKYGDTIWRCKV